MSNIPHNFGLYVILTNPLRGYAHLTELCVKHNIAFVQLRAKECPFEDILKSARVMRSITAKTATRFIVNDYINIAAESEADGVHLGQDDSPIESARQVLGPSAIIGLSTHSPKQVRYACEQRPDYIGIGPLFPTPTKKIADPAIGIDGMKTMLPLAQVPAVVLGSITLSNLPSILAAGARNFSMVRPINDSNDPGSVISSALDIWLTNKKSLEI